MKTLDYHWNPQNHIFFSDKFGWILYSGANRSCIVIDEKIKDKLNDFKNKNIPLENTFLEKLEALDIVTNKKTEEIIRQNNFKFVKYQNSHILDLTISPVFIEKYKDRSSHTIQISKSLVSKIIAFCNTKNNRIIHLAWYGQEPLFAYNFIRNLTRQMKINNIVIHQSIVTDGELLHNTVLSYLIKNNCTQIQILLSNECLKNEEKYSKILDNIERAYNYLSTNKIHIDFSINVCVSWQTKNNFLKVRSYFKERYGNYFNVFYSLETNKEKCPDWATTKYVSEPDFYEITKLDKYYNIFGRNLLSETSDFCFCNAQCLNSYVIDYAGFVYKCWNDVGNKDKAVYDLNEGQIVNSKVEFEYIMMHSNYLEPCKDCYLATVCRGGCSFERMNGHATCSAVAKKHFVEIVELAQKKFECFEI